MINITKGISELGEGMRSKGGAVVGKSGNMGLVRPRGAPKFAHVCHFLSVSPARSEDPQPSTVMSV